jgi:hypothetical protein
MPARDLYAQEKLEMAAAFERHGVECLRVAADRDPGTFAALVLMAVGPQEARQYDEPTNAQLEFLTARLIERLREGASTEPRLLH